MKNLSRAVTLFSLFLVFAFAPAIVVHAAPSVGMAFQDHAPMNLDEIFATLKNLGGVALLIAALVNVGKEFGWIKEGQAPGASLVLNTVALGALVALQLMGKSDLVPGFDAQAGAIANVINTILALVFQLFIGRKGHENVLAGLPVIGTSYSGRRAGEPSAFEITEAIEG